MPLVRDFYTPFAVDVALKQKELRPADIGLATDQVCSEGHPMVIRAGRYAEYLACANYPEHKETRPLASTEAPPELPKGEGAEVVGQPCPECGADHGGILGVRRGRFGPFISCSRYPDCRYIHKTGPPPPDQLPFQVTCPTCGQGHLATRTHQHGDRPQASTARQVVQALRIAAQVEPLPDAPLVKHQLEAFGGGDHQPPAGGFEREFARRVARVGHQLARVVHQDDVVQVQLDGAVQRIAPEAHLAHVA